MQRSGSEQTWVNMKRKEETHECELVAGRALIGRLTAARALPLFLFRFVPVEHICSTTEGNVKCSGYPVAMKLQVE